ncbi:hybrid sensor histidine kinase/response regulator [Geomesophilobacter sediminis]|uniref:histidine kinase n=1 Tax=Geomesophilobacter sediminis TaxID=2798584 RepID=A0A8J7JLR5_9BACT|nr:response regulator [Geomesophilobacter sediminis]MBJ6725310.1 response regulator [Geomesophilobacter sediminis]
MSDAETIRDGHRGHRILIVDDSPTQARLLEYILMENGYEVAIAQNGRLALERILETRPDLVVSDILMPEMDGFELCRRVRETDAVQSTPIILLTLLNNPADVLHSLEAGATHFISKPYNAELLLSRIAATLKSGAVCYDGGDEAPIEVPYRGQRYRVSAPREQIVDFLLSTYETAVEKNRELLNAKKSLWLLNRELEQRVEERSAALQAETTERLLALEELRRKDEVLMQQSRQAALGEMIGNIAHQWRQPLNAVGLLVQDISLCHECGGFTDEYLQTTTEKIMEIIRHMSQTIDDFRNFFMPDKEKVPFCVADVVARALSLVEGAFLAKGIEVDVVGRPDAVILGYPNEFSQVLLNILSNARDAFLDNPHGEPRIVVQTETTPEGRVVLKIADNAGGIPEEVIGRIFEPYFTTKEEGQGTGVGLYMAKNIIEKNMNGSLTVRNVGGGAEFTIEV